MIRQLRCRWEFPSNAYSRSHGLSLLSLLLAMALAAMGLETDLRKLAAAGGRPALLGAAAWVFIMGVSLALIILTGAA